MIGVLSDAHGNESAFRKSVEMLRKRGASKFIFLGDSVGYMPMIGVVKALREMGPEVRCIKGNHEVMLLNGVDDPAHEDIYRLASVRRDLTQDDLDFLAGWGTHHSQIIKGNRLFFVHGSPDDFTNGYVYPDTDLTSFDVDFDFVFMGHSHYPFIRKAGSVSYVNVGSVGLPRDDGRFGSCAIFDPADACAEVLRFDITQDTSRMLRRSAFVHDSVKAVFARRRKEVFGTLMEDGGK